VLTSQGAIPSLGGRELHCRGADGALSPEAGGPCAPALGRIRRKERAYVGLLDWFVRRQAIAWRRPGAVPTVRAAP
jgi:hypothetical protein